MIIHKYITHVLDKNSDIPILNDFEGNISASIDRFLQSSIKKIGKDDLLRKAKFKDREENIINNCCEAIIYNEKTFIKNSKEIASYLFEVMKSSHNIESCDLVICLYTIKDERKIAIIKYDYKAMFNHEINYEDDKFKIRMVKAETMISESTKPNQFAIVGTSGLNDEYDLKVLDKYAEKKSEKSSFIEEFLKVKKVEDDTYKTREFSRIANTWISNYYSDDIPKAEYMRSLLTYKLCSNSVMDIYEFGQQAFDSKEARESFNELMLEHDLEKFNIDKKCAEKLLRVRNVKTNTEFDIKAKSIDLFNSNKYEIKKNSKGTYDIVIKDVMSITVT